MEMEKVWLFIRVCMAYAASGYLTGLKPEELICLYEECLVMALFSHDNVTERNLYLQLGDMYGKIHQFVRAIECYEKCLSVTIGNKMGEMLLYKKLGSAHQSLGRYHEAIKHHERYLCIATEIGDIQGELIAYGSLGNAYESLGEFHEAIKCYKRCLSISTEIGHRQGEGSAYGNLGNAYRSLGKYHEAIKYLERCLSIATEIGDRRGEGTANRSLGMTYQTLFKYQEAIKYHEKYLSVATEIGDRQGEGSTCRNLGIAYWSLGEYQKAIKYHEKHLSIAKEIGDKKGEGSAYGNLGNVCYALRKYHEAIKYYENSLSILKDIGDRKGEGVAHGNLANSYWSLGKYHEALKYGETCLGLATETGDRQVEGSAYRSLGNAYQSLCQNLEAIKYYEKHLSIATEIGDRQGEGSAHGNLGNAYYSLGKYLEAIKYYEKHLSITKEIGDRQGEGTASGNLGNAYHALGKYHEAIEYLERCLSIAVKIGDRKGEGNANGSLGIAYHALGKYHEAIAYQEKHLTIATEIGDREGEGSANGTLGNAYWSLGKYHEAIQYHENSLRIAMEMGDRQGEGSSYEGLGNAHRSLGKYHEAIIYHEKHLSIATEIGDRQGEASAFRSLGKAYLSLGKYHEAIKYHEKCLGIATEIGDRQGEGTAYGNLGNVYESLGEFHETIKYHQKCLSVATEIGDRRGEGSAYGNLGNAYQSLGKYHEAIENHKNFLSIATETCDRQREGVAHHNIGLCYEQDANADHLRKSKEHLYKSIQCFELLFDDLKEKDQLKISIFDTFIKSYKNLSRLCLKTAQTDEALLVSERGRARALGDLLSLKYNVNKEPASKKAPLTLTDVNDVIVPTSCVLFYDVPFGTDNIVLMWVLAQQNPFFVGIRINRAESKLAADKNEDDKEFITNFVKKSYDNMKVREGVDCEDRSLGVLHGEKQGIVEEPAVSESTQVAERETTKANKIDENVLAHIRCLEDHDDVADEKALESIFEVLVAPVQDKLIQEEIVIIPDGPLFMVPFAALKDPKTGKFLSEMKLIRLSPSLTTLKLLQESPDDHHYKSGALIVGNPQIGKVKFGGESFCSLPGAEQEAKEIAKLLEVEPLIGRQATKEVVLQRLRVGVSVIHFAAHGSENGQILLAPSPSSATNSIPDEEDYVLTLQEAQESGLRAQLVVLSCCHSGRGEIKAEGVVGMARAFLAAGARAVVASLWAIDDDATKEFMLKFYSHLRKGESASKSLQQAMKDMRETECYKEPKYWAAFFLIGDDVTIRENKEPKKEKGEREIAENE